MVETDPKKDLLTDESEKTKILWFLGLLSICTTPIFIYGYSKWGAPAASFAVLLSVPFFLLNYIIWRIFHSSAFAGNFIIAIGYFLFLAISIYTGGVDSPAIIWTVAIPMVATTICGLRSGFVWFVLVVLKIGILEWMDFHGNHFIHEIPEGRELDIAFCVNTIAVVFFTFFISASSEFYKEKYLKRIRESNEQLQKALDSIRTLKGLLPICAWCKKIRNDKGYWDKLETYVSANTEAEFTHGICPECLSKQIKKVNPAL